MALMLLLLPLLLLFATTGTGFMSNSPASKREGWDSNSDRLPESVMVDVDVVVVVLLFNAVVECIVVVVVP